MHIYMYIICMPTIKNLGPFKFYFWSNEPKRAHVHVKHTGLDIETLIWLDTLEIKKSSGNTRIDNMAIKLVEDDLQTMKDGWTNHFGEENED